jgi:hypothetical protein
VVTMQQEVCPLTITVNTWASKEQGARCSQVQQAPSALVTCVVLSWRISQHWLTAGLLISQFSAWQVKLEDIEKLAQVTAEQRHSSSACTMS